MEAASGPMASSPLQAANGSSIRTYGKHILDLHLSIGTYKWEFVVAEVTRPLLGADFLRAHSLLVDINTKQLVDTNTFTSTPLVHTSLLAPNLGSITNSTDKYASLIAKFPVITAPQFTQLAPRGWAFYSITRPTCPCQSQKSTIRQTGHGQSLVW